MEVQASVLCILHNHYLIKMHLINSIINRYMHSQYIITQCIVNVHFKYMCIMQCLIHMNYYMQQFCDYSFINDIRVCIAQGGLESYVLTPCWVLSVTNQSVL